MELDRGGGGGGGGNDRGVKCDNKIYIYIVYLALYCRLDDEVGNNKTSRTQKKLFNINIFYFISA